MFWMPEPDAHTIGTLIDVTMLVLPEAGEQLALRVAPSHVSAAQVDDQLPPACQQFGICTYDRGGNVLTHSGVGGGQSTYSPPACFRSVPACFGSCRESAPPPLGSRWESAPPLQSSHYSRMHSGPSMSHYPLHVTLPAPCHTTRSMHTPGTAGSGATSADTTPSAVPVSYE